MAKAKDKENPERYLYIQSVDLQRDKENHGTLKESSLIFIMKR